MEALRTMSTQPKQHSNPLDALSAIIVEMAQTIEVQQYRIADLSRRVFGKKSERRSGESQSEDAALQGHLFHAELIAEAERTAELKNVQGDIEVAPPKNPKKKGGGRRATYPDHLPTTKTRYELEDDAKHCKNCGGDLHRIGWDVSRELERLETAIIHTIMRAKYGCRCCGEGVTTAPGPDRLIEKGIMGPGFTANVAVERFGNHLPYNRLEKKYKAEGLSLSRSVLERTMAKLAEAFAPIATQIRKEILDEPVLFTDDTGVVVARPPGRLGSSKGFVWIYLSRDGKHSYDFTMSREGKGPQAILSGYTGFIHADAYPGLDKVFAPGGAIEVACWCHVRRKFVEAEETSPHLSKDAVNRIRELFRIERTAKEQELDDDARLELRQKYSQVIVDELFAWMAEAETQVLPKSPMGKALRYALKLEIALRQFLTDGRLEMENNAAERALRAVAVGRKNWEFFLNEKGGNTAAILFSVVMTAKAIGINPVTYLLDVQSRLFTETDVGKLTPHGWKKHFADEVEQRRQAIVASLTGI